ASQTTETTNPNDVQWAVIVNNPNGTSGTQRTVWIKDANVTVTSGPFYTNGASCTGTFADELVDSNGVECTMPAGSQIVFYVKPSPAPQRTCQDRQFNNTAYLYIDSTTATPVSAQGPTITLKGDPALCNKTLKICKVLVGNGDGIVRSGTFNFDVRNTATNPATVLYNGLPGGGLAVSEPNPDTAGTKGTEACEEVSVPATAVIEVVEWGSRPTGWTGDAAGYPKYAINGGNPASGGTTTTIDMANQTAPVVTFYNKEKLEKKVTFSKYICPTFSQVPRNQGPGGQDDTGKPVFPGGGLNGLLGPKGPSNDSAPVTPTNDNRGQDCVLATTPWTFQLWTEDRVNGSGGTLLQTVNVSNGTATVDLETDVLEALLKDGVKWGVYVEEVYQPGYAFGALKCYTDHLNDDNWEWLSPSILTEQGEVHCIAYNVPITPPKLTVKKVTQDASGNTIQSDQDFSFTVEPTTGVNPTSFVLDTDPNSGLVSDQQVVTLPASGQQGGVAYTITEGSIPSAWELASITCTGGNAQVNLQNGTVTVTLETGGVAGQASDVTCTFTNRQRKGNVVIHKVYPQGFSPDGATFTGTLDGGTDYSWTVQVGSSQALEVVPGFYTVTEDPKTGYELIGIATASQTAYENGYPGAAIACGAETSQVVANNNQPDVIVNPGETQHIWVCNRPLGTVVIVKYENVPPDTAQTWNFTGNLPSGL
ncbi:hypothetical protein, partial [Tepidiforma sp.]|uniref:prealbumin-like fold domain-containing protein n=1 Tax=Tepidiforma sp. TaxID=2682230 RepID=UPI002ADD644A